MYPPHHKQVICVKNLPEYNDQIIHHLFGNFGKIITYRFVNTPDHYRKDAIVEFEHPQAPFDACNIHNGRVIGNNKLYVEILPMEQVHVPNHRPIELNIPRPPFDNRNEGLMGGPDFRKVDQFRNYENNGHFHGQRNEIFHMQGRSNNDPNNFSQGINHEMQHRPEINRGPEFGNNIHPPKFHPGPPPPINNPMHFQQNINFRPINQPIGHQVPNSPVYNEYRPPPNAIPNTSPGRIPPNNVHHYPNNVIISPQQQNMNSHNMYPVRLQQDNRNNSIEQSPRTEDANITAALAKYPELKAQIGNPEFMKTIIDICRKEAPALIENKLSNQQDIRSSHNKQHSNRRDHSRSRSRSRSWSRSRSRHHHSSNKNHFNNIDSRRTEYNNHHRSRSRSYSRSRSHSRSHSCSRSPAPDTYSRQYPQGNRSPIRENQNQYYHNKYSNDQKRKHYEQRSSRSRSRSNQRERYRHHSRSRSRERDPNYLDKQRQPHLMTEKPFRNQNKNNAFRMEIYKERKTLVIGGDGQGQSLNPHFKKNKAMANRENGDDVLHPIVCEDQDLSQSTAGDSILIDQSNLQETYKHQAGVQQQLLSQHKDQPQKFSKLRSNTEIELKYPQFDQIISKMEAYRENEKQNSFYNQRRMDCMVPKKPMAEKKFVYSSRMEENKESNYPFDPDYDWPLATALGVYPDDLGSLDFMKNLEGNIRNLLEIPQACPLDIGTFNKNMCDTLLRNENIVSNKTTGELLDEPDVIEKEEMINKVNSMVDRRYNDGALQDDLYEIQMDEGGREKGVTPVKGSYSMRNNSIGFRNRFFGSRNMNSFRGRNKPFDH